MDFLRNMFLRLGILCAFCMAISLARNPTVKTKLGNIEGVHSLSYGGRKYSAFIGIPYAQPPIGNLRFKEAEPKTKWDGNFIANSSVYCIQVGHFIEPEGGPLMGDEDCLYLSVYVPRENPQKGDNLDVVVHIHSGAFNFGSGDDYAGPKYIMDRDMIFITINYRLGPLGFMSTEDVNLPGNIGMKDQVAALRWIQDNINQFGGNPNSVTITGLSAGGASVHFHLLSPRSRGLFTRGVSMSGVTLDPWPIQEGALAKARIIGSQVGCNCEDTLELIECMRQRPARQIVNAVRILRPWLYNPFSPFGVVVDKHDEKPFLPEHPYKMMTEDTFWMCLGLHFAVKDNYLPDLERRWEELAPFVLDYNCTIPSNKLNSISEQIKQHYLGDEAISKESFQKLIKMMSDRLFIAYAEKAARLQANINKSPVYFYYFSYPGEKVDTYAWHYTGSPEKYGVCHGDDSMYFMSNPKKPLTRMTKTDTVIKELFLDMWESFAKTGIPLINTGLTWKPVQKNAEMFDYLHIESDTSILMKQSKELGERSFWESIPFLENENLI